LFLRSSSRPRNAAGTPPIASAIRPDQASSHSLGVLGRRPDEHVEVAGHAWDAVKSQRIRAHDDRRNLVGVEQLEQLAEVARGSIDLSAEDLDSSQTGRYRLPPPIRRIVAGRGRINERTNADVSLKHRDDLSARGYTE
jgi:hypothetical protein